MNLNITRQKQEIGSLSRLAAPIVLSQLSLMGIGVTDVIVSGRAGVTDLAGVTLGNNTWNMVIYFFFGIAMANQPLIAELFGKKDSQGLRFQFHQSIWMALIIGLLSVAAISLAVKLLGRLDSDPAALEVAIEYLKVMALGAIAMTILPVLRTTLEAINQTKVVLAINFSAFLINIPLDIALVHGWGIFPKLGGVGCAWASVIILWLCVIATYLVLVFRRSNSYLGLRSRFSRPDARCIFSTMKIGVPIGFSILIELGLFGGAAIIIATLGDVDVAAHAVAINAASVAYMVYFGTGQAITILGAQRLGANLFREAVDGIYFGIKMTVLFAVLFSAIIVIFRTPIASLYTGDAQVIALAAQLLIWSAIFQIADALQVTSICGLRAFKETKSPPLYQIFSFWIVAFPLGYIITKVISPDFMPGPHGFWFAMTFGLIVASILLFMKLRRFTQNIVQ